MTYGVFILENGNWKLVMSCTNLSSAKVERDYWRSAWNVTAEVFKKAA